MLLSEYIRTLSTVFYNGSSIIFYSRPKFCIYLRAMIFKNFTFLHVLSPFFVFEVHFNVHDKFCKLVIFNYPT